MNEDNERLRLLVIFHYVVAGFAALLSFFPLLYSIVGGFLLYAAYHPGPGNQEPAASVSRLDLYFAGRVLLLRWRYNGHLYSHCRRMPFPSQSLLLRARRGLRRMFLHSFRNNSRSLHDCCTLARVCKGVIFDRTIASVKIARSVPRAVSSGDRLPLPAITVALTIRQTTQPNFAGGETRRRYSQAAFS